MDRRQSKGLQVRSRNLLQRCKIPIQRHRNLGVEVKQRAKEGLEEAALEEGVEGVLEEVAKEEAALEEPALEEVDLVAEAAQEEAA